MRPAADLDDQPGIRPEVLVLTCEHGGNRVPARYRGLFASRRARAALASHRGHDIGALTVARALQRRFGVPLVHSTVTRLLVDLNRSVGHAGLFSEFVIDLSGAERERVLAAHYHPHRVAVEQTVAEHLRHGRCTLHLSVHSFTPRLGGQTRVADLGLLYDPRRAGEREFCARWKAALVAGDAGLRVRRNYPYRGKDDGLTTALRRHFGLAGYLGVELEINQALLGGAPGDRQRVIRAVAGSLSGLLGGHRGSRNFTRGRNLAAGPA